MHHVRTLKERGQLGRYFAAVNIDAILIPDKRESYWRIGGPLYGGQPSFRPARALDHSRESACPLPIIFPIRRRLPQSSDARALCAR